MTPQDDPLLWPFSGAQMVLETWLSWLGKQPQPPRNARDEVAVPWTTSHRVALELTTMQLRDFSRQGSGQPLLICAPYALHTALIADFAPEHSIVEALLRGGRRRLYVTDWRSATASMRSLSIDSYLAEFNVAVDEIGPPVDLVGLCQGGWLSLVYAARFPEKVRRLVLAGAPVDVSTPSALSQMVANLPAGAFEGLVSAATGLMNGRQMQPAWSASLNAQVEDALQWNPSPTTDHDRELVERFERWDDNIVDLPGVYYVQVADWIFRQNRIAEGRFVALGQPIDLRQLKVPTFLLAGMEDRVVPPEQALATARLLGTPPAHLQMATEHSGHLGLFMGRKTLKASWRRIADWLAADLTEDATPAAETERNRLAVRF